MPLDSNGKEQGWIHKYAFQVGAISADKVGRSAVADKALTEQMMFDPSNNSLNMLRVARYTYDFTVQGGVQGNLVLTGTALPAGVLAIGGLVSVKNALTSGGASTASLVIEGANDLITDTAVAGAPWSTTGSKAIVPIMTAGTSILTTISRTPLLVVTTADLTGGKFNLFLIYVVPD